MKVIVFVIVIVGSEARYGVLRCHATPKINFCHLEARCLGRNTRFRGKPELLALFVVASCIVNMISDTVEFSFQGGEPFGGFGTP